MVQICHQVMKKVFFSFKKIWETVNGKRERGRERIAHLQLLPNVWFGASHLLKKKGRNFAPLKNCFLVCAAKKEKIDFPCT